MHHKIDTLTLYSASVSFDELASIESCSAFVKAVDALPEEKQELWQGYSYQVLVPPTNSSRSSEDYYIAVESDTNFQPPSTVWSAFDKEFQDY